MVERQTRWLEGPVPLLGRVSSNLTLGTSMAPWPSGKAEVCKTSIHQFESGQRLFPVPFHARAPQADTLLSLPADVRRAHLAEL